MQSKSNSVGDPSIFKIRLTVVLVLAIWGNRCQVHFSTCRGRQKQQLPILIFRFRFWSFRQGPTKDTPLELFGLLWSYLYIPIIGRSLLKHELGNIRDVEYPAFHLWLSWYVQALPQHWPFCFPHQLSTITFRQVGALEGGTGSPSIHAQWFSEKWRDCQIFWPWIGRLLAQPTLWCTSEWRQISPPIPRSGVLCGLFSCGKSPRGNVKTNSAHVFPVVNVREICLLSQWC